MASIVITAIGDDRAGLVDALAQVVAEHHGNWERSHMADLAGKFAGIVLVTLADDATGPFLVALDGLEASGLLDITAVAARDKADDPDTTSVSLELVGQDHPGIVHEVSHVLAVNGVSIDELETQVVSAPQGGNLFQATAVLHLPKTASVDQVRLALEAVATDLMVDLNLT